MVVSHRYFTAKSELEIDFASVIAMDFMKVFLLFFRILNLNKPKQN